MRSHCCEFYDKQFNWTKNAPSHTALVLREFWINWIESALLHFGFGEVMKEARARQWTRQRTRQWLRLSDKMIIIIGFKKKFWPFWWSMECQRYRRFCHIQGDSLGSLETFSIHMHLVFCVSFFASSFLCFDLYASEYTEILQLAPAASGCINAMRIFFKHDAQRKSILDA